MNKFNLKDMKKKIVLIVLIIISVAGYFVYKNASGSNRAVETNKLTQTVKIGDIVSAVSASGQIETANYLPITTSVNGIVKEVFVKEGDSVTQGQKIMEITLDSEGQSAKDSAYSNYLKAKNSVESAKNSLYSLETSKIQKEEAFEDEKERNSYQSQDERVAFKIAENDFIKAEKDYERQQSEISQLQIALSSSYKDYQAQSPIITATSNGIIANIISVQGTKIENSVSERSVQTVASIKIEGTPIASLNVTEIDISKIKVGQKVRLKLNSISDKTFSGIVVGIDKIGEVSSGVSNYPVIIKFDEENENILPNMGVEADIVIYEKSEVLLIPTSAVIKNGGKKIVTKIENGKDTKVEIEIGVSDNENTEVTSGLSEGDVVSVSSLPKSGFNSQETNFRQRNVTTGAPFIGGGPR